jgi:hypothetical protein
MSRADIKHMDERWTVVAGLLGMAVAMLYACSDSGGTTATDAGADGPGTNDSATAGSDGAATLPGDGGPSGASCQSDPGTATNGAAVVAAANALLAALTPAQQTAIKYDKTLPNAEQWSNLPTTFVKRNGVKIGDMSAEAQAAAVALAQAAAGPTGSTLFSEIREADEFLVTDGKASAIDYGRGLYYFSIHGTPSASAAWMLQIAGHHLAYNFTYGGKCTSATPLFDGVEPTTWTDGAGTNHAPLEAQRATLVALLASMAALPEAQLAGTFSDLINGPVGGGPGGGTGGDTKYPASLSYPTGTTGRGVSGAALSADQKTLLKRAIEAWVKNAADPVSAAILSQYESEQGLAQTYVAYSGSPDLTTQASYARIDGPRVWIEFTVQGGIVYRSQVHYHTIWRDKASDYGAEYISQ